MDDLTKPDILELDTFTKGIYKILDPQERGYVDLKRVDLSSLSDEVANFTQVVLEQCATEVDPSEFVFRDDLEVRLMQAVEREWAHIRAPSSPLPYRPTELSLTPRTSPAHSTTSSNVYHEQSLSRPVPSAEESSAHFLSRLSEHAQQHASNMSRMRAKHMLKDLETCTFTPAVPKRPEPTFPREKFTRSKPERSSKPEGPASGQGLVEEVEVAFLKGLRSVDDEPLRKHDRSIVDRLSQKSSTSRLSTPRRKGSHTRAFLIHRMNEADNLWKLLNEK